METNKTTGEKLNNFINKDIMTEKFKQFLTKYKVNSANDNINMALNYLIETSTNCDIDILLDTMNYIIDVNDPEHITNILKLFEYNQDEDTIATDGKYLYLGLMSPFILQRYEKKLEKSDKDLTLKISRYFDKIFEDNKNYGLPNPKEDGYNI